MSSWAPKSPYGLQTINHRLLRRSFQSLGKAHFDRISKPCPVKIFVAARDDK